MLLVSITGCIGSGKKHFMEKVSSDANEQADVMMQSIIKALEEQDVESLKGLFSPYALQHAENLDEKIVKLMEFYPGSNGGYEGVCSGSRPVNYGDVTLILNGKYTVKNDEKEYQVKFVTIPQNDEEPDKVGLYLIEVMTEEAKPEGFKWRNEEDGAGIYVLE